MATASVEYPPVRTVGVEHDDDLTRRIASAWRELRRGASTTALRQHLVGRPRLEQSQFDALEVLVAVPNGMRMSEFADAMRVEPSTATRTLTRLERQGLATRSIADGDRRVVGARATTLGQRTVRDVLARRAISMERLLEPFDPAERVELAVYLERLVASIDRIVAELDEASKRP